MTVQNSAGVDTLVEQTYITVNEPVLPPTADFSGAPREGKAPLTVTFLDLSKNNPKQWYWKFGDGASSEERNPVHTYAAEGRYTVELTVSNEGGADTKIVPDYITVTPPGFPPEAKFRGSPPPELPRSLSALPISRQEILENGSGTLVMVLYQMRSIQNIPTTLLESTP
mgnify:CR=1 FL=1